MDIADKLTNIAAGILISNRKVLVALRNEGEWEFPGGKLEKDERFEDAIIRELKEELDIIVKPVEEVGSIELDIDENNVHIFSFILVEGDHSCMKTKVHKECKFVNIAELKSLKLSKADNLFVTQYETDLKKYID